MTNDTFFLLAYPCLIGIFGLILWCLPQGGAQLLYSLLGIKFIASLVLLYVFAVQTWWAFGGMLVFYFLGTLLYLKILEHHETRD